MKDRTLPKYPQYWSANRSIRISNLEKALEAAEREIAKLKKALRPGPGRDPGRDPRAGGSADSLKRSILEVAYARS